MVYITLGNSFAIVKKMRTDFKPNFILRIELAIKGGRKKGFLRNEWAIKLSGFYFSNIFSSRSRKFSFRQYKTRRKIEWKKVGKLRQEEEEKY